MVVKHISQELQELFIAQCEALAVSSGFQQRASRITASAWVQGLVFGWLANPQSTVAALSRALAVAGAPASPQAVQQRFNEKSALLLRQVLESMSICILQQSACKDLRRADAAWLKAFPAIWLRDSTLIRLPNALSKEWTGTGEADTAGLKVSVQWEWHSGQLAPLQLNKAVVHDQKAAQEHDERLQKQGRTFLPGEMHVFDLGFFSLAWLKQLAQNDAYFCCRYKAGTHLKHLGFLGKEEHHDHYDSGAWQTSPLPWLNALPADVSQAECEVLLGSKARVRTRLVAVRVPTAVAFERRQTHLARSRRKRQKVSEERLALCAWNLYVTNATTSVLSGAQVRVLYGLRWQIERLFRLWKETLQADDWRSQNPQRILCEVWAKLLGALLTQRLTSFCGWHDTACSLVKCAQTISEHALALLVQLKSRSGFKRQLDALMRACSTQGARLEKRKAKPATFQRIGEVQIP